MAFSIRYLLAITIKIKQSPTVNIFFLWSQVFYPAKKAYAFKYSIVKYVRGIYPSVTCKGSLPLIPCGPVPKIESDSPWLLPICTSLDFNRCACTYIRTLRYTSGGDCTPAQVNRLVRRSPLSHPVYSKQAMIWWTIFGHGFYWPDE